MGMFGAMGSAMGMGGNAGPMQRRPGMPMQGQNPGMMGQPSNPMMRGPQMRNPANPGMGGGMAPSPQMQQKMMPGMMGGGMKPGMMGGMQKPAPMMGGGMEQMPQVR